VGDGISSVTFAGREAELSRLREIVGALDTTGARTVLIGGDAGIGKSRLLAELAAVAATDGALVATGACTSAEGGGLPYAPVVGALRDLTGQLDEITVATMLAGTRRAFGLDPINPMDGIDSERPSRTTSAELLKTRRFETLLQSLVSLSGLRPIVVIFEDLHWADTGTIEVVDFLTRNLRDHPVLVVGTYRTDEFDAARPLPTVLTELGRHRGVVHIELGGLDRDAVAALMAGILGQQPEWSLLDAVYSRSEGNPFFAEELTAWRDTSSIPSSLRKLITLRVDRLQPDARDLVALASAAGSVVDHRLLRAAAELDDARLHAAAADAVAGGILAVDDRTGFRFRHALQRDAIYGTLLPTERTMLHRRLAAALSAHPELGAPGPGHAAVELAEHWWEAGEWSHAARTSIAAGDAMQAMLAMPEAHAQYEHALAACDFAPGAVPDAPERQRLVEQAADTAYFSGNSERARELARVALDGVDASVDAAQAASCHARLARYTFALGETEQAFEEFTTAASLLPLDPPSEELAAIAAHEARCLLVMSRIHDAEARALEAIAFAQAAGSIAAEGHALDTFGMCRGLLGHIDEGLDAVRRALVIAEQFVLPDNLNLGYAHLSLLLLLGGRDAAARVALDGESVGETLGGIRLNGATANSAQALIDLGRYDDAEAMLAGASGFVGNCNTSPSLLFAALNVRRGAFEEATSLCKVLDTLTAHLEDVQFRGNYHMVTAELALAEGRTSDARDEIEHALALGLGSDDPMVAEMCAVGVKAIVDDFADARARGRQPDLDAARARAASLVAAAEVFVTEPARSGGAPLPASVAFLAQCRAECSQLDTPDPQLWAEAADRWETLSRPFDAAYCRWREAEAALQQSGGRRRATSSIDRAWRAAVGVGAAGLCSNIARFSQRARLDLSFDDATPVDSVRQRVADELGLTDRQVEVLDQLARGRSDGQIADALFISKKTVSVHVSSVLRKLDVGNRIAAGDIGQRAGLGINEQ
jgi:DNA-binding CsgD family transcriptional regulator/tetratricopeptide (TPR) repeat protein